MKILASADIHGERASLQWLVETAIQVKPEAIILAGDLLGSPVEYSDVRQAQLVDAERTVDILMGADRPILYIMGNDDLVPLTPRSDHLRSLQGKRISLGKYNFVGYQYSLPFMGGIYEKPEEDIEQDLLELEPLVDGDTVLVTHSPAYGILDLGIMDRHAGSKSLLNLIKRAQPRAHVHGHIHREFGRFGIHFNVASDMRKRAVLIDLDSLKHSYLEDSMNQTGT